MLTFSLILTWSEEIRNVKKNKDAEGKGEREGQSG